MGATCADNVNSTIQVFHSTGATALTAVLEVVVNDNSGLGEHHFALLKAADAND
jgi:hypothetical protein